jgi:hypothetical protein
MDGVAVGSFVGISEDFVEGLTVGYSLSSKVGFDVIEGFSLGRSVNVGLKGLATVGAMLFDGAELVDGAILFDGISEGVEFVKAATTGGRCAGLNKGAELVDGVTREGRCTVGDVVNIR